MGTMFSTNEPIKGRKVENGYCVICFAKRRNRINKELIGGFLLNLYHEHVQN